MTHYFSSEFTLGILGGGQLGKMLLYETRKFDIKTNVIYPRKRLVRSLVIILRLAT
jgi:5-(carboxyamino)imidazole ribonucleotide synthase